MKKNKKTILYITELVPYPPISGGTIKTFNTIQTLSKKFNIVLICFNKDQPTPKQISKIKKYVQDVKVFLLPNIDQAPNENILLLIKNYLQLKPYFLFHAFSNEARKFINDLIRKKKFDIIHIDHTCMAQYLPKNKKQTWILEEHNIEHQIAWTQFVSFKKWKKTKLFLFFEFLLVYHFEKGIYKKFDHIFAISDYDYSKIEKLFQISKQKISSQILVYEKQKIIRVNKKNQIKKILFIGDLTWLPNKQAIEWFVENIFPLILKKEPRVVFEIVGKIEVEFLNYLSHKKNTNIYGFQKDIKNYLSKADVFVLPFKSGGGIRVKALEAFSNGIPVVTTTLGIQGLTITNLKQCLVADSVEIFAQYCLLLLRNHKINSTIGKNGQMHLNNVHSSQNNNILITKYLETIL